MTELQAAEVLTYISEYKHILIAQFYMQFVILGGMAALAFFSFWKRVF